MKVPLRSLCFVLCVAMSAAVSAGPVLNPSFEDAPDWTGWTVTGADNNTYVNRTGSSAYVTDGEAGAVLDFTGGYDIVGRYGIGWAAILRSDAFAAGAGDIIQVDWRLVETQDNALGRGFLVDAVTDAVVETFFNVSTAPGINISSAWSTASVTVPTADTYKLKFQVGSYDATGGTVIGAELRLDNVTVETNSAIPEPATLSLLGLGGLALLRRRRRR